MTRLRLRWRTMANSTPKCLSWRGHKFEGRYSTVETPNPVAKGNIEGSQDAVIALIGTMKLHATTYHGDVCVRCGTVVNAQETK